MTAVSRDQLVAIAKVKAKDNLYDFEHHLPVWVKAEIACVLCCAEWVGAYPTTAHASWWECLECHGMTGQTLRVLSDVPLPLPVLLGMS